MVAVTTYMAPHPKYASPAQILSKFQIPGSPCFWGSSDSKLNLRCFLNISSPCVPYLSCSYTNLENFPLQLLFTPRHQIHLFSHSDSWTLLLSWFPCCHPFVWVTIISPQDSPPSTCSLVLSKVFAPSQPPWSWKTLSRHIIHPPAWNLSCVLHFPKVPKSLGGLAPIALSAPSLLTSLYSLHFSSTDLSVTWTHTFLASGLWHMLFPLPRGTLTYLHPANSPSSLRPLP